MSVTYEEMNQARDTFVTARQEFSIKYYDFLTTVLKEAGVCDKLVKIKGERDLIGQFKISSDPYDRRPWEIKFYPITLSGKVSLKSKYLLDFRSWNEDSLVEQLQKIAEVVGEAPCE